MSGDVTFNQVSSAEDIVGVGFLFWVFVFLVQDSITIHF